MYTPPIKIERVELTEPPQTIYCAGALTLMQKPCVSLIGPRKAGPMGLTMARALARELAGAGAVIMSGLAHGVDTAALTSAVAHNGRVCAVIPSPLDHCYPKQNDWLQTRIWQDHLLVSQFAIGEPLAKRCFIMRNRLMARLSIATLVVEPHERSGTRHQAAECIRLGRPLFFCTRQKEHERPAWVRAHIALGHATTINSAAELIAAINGGLQPHGMPNLRGS